MWKSKCKHDHRDTGLINNFIILSNVKEKLGGKSGLQGFMRKLLKLQCELRERDEGIRGNVLDKETWGLIVQRMKLHLEVKRQPK